MTWWGLRLWLGGFCMGGGLMAASPGLIMYLAVLAAGIAGVAIHMREGG